jgi:hypothetical protein
MFLFIVVVMMKIIFLFELAEPPFFNNKIH